MKVHILTVLSSFPSRNNKNKSHCTKFLYYTFSYNNSIRPKILPRHIQTIRPLYDIFTMPEITFNEILMNSSMNHFNFQYDAPWAWYKLLKLSIFHMLSYPNIESLSWMQICLVSLSRRLNSRGVYFFA